MKRRPPDRNRAVDSVKQPAKGVIGSVQTVKRVPVSLTNDHLAGRGSFEPANWPASRRGNAQRRLHLSNELNFYLPLAKVDNSSPAYAKTVSYVGDRLQTTGHCTISRRDMGTFKR